MLSRLMTVREQAILGALALAIVTGAVVLAARGGGHAGQVAELPAAEETPPVATTPAQQSPEDDKKIGAAVMGAVTHEGLYWLASDARVKDLVDAAGGPASDANLSEINLAAKLIDTSVLTVPRAGEAAPVNPAAYTIGGAPHSVAASPPSGEASGRNVAAPGGVSPNNRDSMPRRINVNTATQAQLETLPGIGPVTAASIIERRRRQPFRRLEDLLDVSGIGPAKFRDLRLLVSVR